MHYILKSYHSCYFYHRSSVDRKIEKQNDLRIACEPVSQSDVKEMVLKCYEKKTSENK